MAVIVYQIYCLHWSMAIMDWNVECVALFFVHTSVNKDWKAFCGFCGTVGCTVVGFLVWLSQAGILSRDSLLVPTH